MIQILTNIMSLDLEARTHTHTNTHTTAKFMST